MKTLIQESIIAFRWPLTYAENEHHPVQNPKRATVTRQGYISFIDIFAQELGALGSQ